VRSNNTVSTSSAPDGLVEQRTDRPRGLTRPALIGLTAWVFGAFLATPAGAQTITVVGTPHLTGLDPSPSTEQLTHAVEALSAFEPTQVCVERMSGERIEVLMADPARNAMTLRPETAGRPLATIIVPVGVEMQAMLERRPADARDEAEQFVSRWDELDTSGRIRVIGLQLAGYEFPSAVLNWSYLDKTEREEAAGTFGTAITERLEETLNSVHEVYSLGVPLARKMGLHQLCTADSQEDETRGIQAATKHGGLQIIDSPEVQERLDEHQAIMADAWRPEDGRGALVALLQYANSDEYEEMDRRVQWETLREMDNEAGAFSRRLMYWHARTAEISAELFRALAKGPDERVLFIVGAAHRPFTEADLGAQPWVEVQSARMLLEAR
jgi:hypothetical protein